MTPNPDRTSSVRARFAQGGAFIARLLRSLLGTFSWGKPPWMEAIGARASQLRAHAAADRKSFLRKTAIGVVVLVGLVFAKVWYDGRPQPTITAYTVSRITETDFRAENPRPFPLSVSFMASVAPLDMVGKTITTGIRTSPEIAGTWRWVTDHQLNFLPADHWPVGQEFKVTFDRTGFFTAGITLDDYSFKYTSPEFRVFASSPAFYQDPIDPAMKRVTMELSFSHPVDTASLRDHVALKAAGAGASLLAGLRSLPFTIRADKDRLQATILSDPLQIPERDGTMRFTMEKGVRSSRGGTPSDLAFDQAVTIPGLFSLTVQQSELTLVRNERYEPEQVLVLSTSADVSEKDLQQGVKAWLLPIYRPGTEVTPRTRPYAWNNPSIIDQQVLDAGTPLTLTPIPSERENTSRIAFRYEATPGRYLYVRVPKGLRAFGGYLLGANWDRTHQVPSFPKEVKILGSGSLLSLSGERKISVYSRDVPGLLMEVGRVLPNQLQHLVTQTSLIFGNTQFSNEYMFDEGNLSSRRADTLQLPPLAPGQASYQPFDLGNYLASSGTPKGLFLVSAQGYDASTRSAVGPADRRLVLLTDIGLLAKRNSDGSQDIFAQSLRTGSPIAGVTVDVLGKNGLPVLSAESDGDGHVRFPSLRSFTREQEPVLYAARRGEDLSFLPIDKYDRVLDLSRFDVGGVSNAIQADQLTAYLFSDRGVYRPGDTFHVGLIVKPANWATSLAGVPLEAVITDARGLEVKRSRIRLSPQGFEELTYGTAETSPTGTWTISLFIVKDGYAGSLLGSTTVNVREFQPDRMAMTAHLSSEAVSGWVSPDELSANITLRNLFGTPAAGRRVTARIELTPGFPTLRGFEAYRFSDPQVAKETYTDVLPEGTTTATGEATFTLGLERYTRATYRLRFIAEGYEAGGGRSVTAEAGVVVSNQPYLVGFKADGDLRYLHKDSERSVDFIAVGPHGGKVAARNLKLARIRISYVSVLARQYDGTYRYQSVKKEIPLTEEPFALPTDGATKPLPTSEPGTFAYIVKDSTGAELAKVEYNVAGSANLARSLERNAELEITLDKGDYAPGETIELQIQAPYTGSGLITIERDHVYSWTWFRTTTTSSVQRIALPAGLEGNGYVSVSFVRDVNSDEVFTTPLSFGVAPFSVDRAARRTNIALQTPTLVKPGDRFTVHYTTDRPSRIAVFAVDEGILQVAGYRTPDPLGFFFEKRALQVQTSQILDQILPEFARLMAAAAPGGDAEGMLGRNLNPFKRRRDPPVAFWSGVRDAGPGGADYTFTVPDYFNGTLRVMAVAVNDGTVGAQMVKSVVRGDFVLSPNLPMMVAPGDTFEVSVGVANNVDRSGKAAPVEVALEVPAGLQVVGPTKTTVPIDAMREGSATFRLVAREQLGNADLVFTSQLGEKSARIRASLSLRPATPYRTALVAGSVRDASATVPVDRTLYTEHRTVNAGMSVVPLSLAFGLSDYLANFPYLCTEQLVSQGVPAMVLSKRPEFGINARSAQASFAKVLDMLRSRQNEEGGYGLWAANTHVDPLVSVYAQHFLIDAKERGFAVPREVVNAGQRYLHQLAAREGSSLAEERTRAYAIYLLTRQGVVTTNYVIALERNLKASYAASWKTDLAGAFLAATYQLLRQEGPANDLIGASKFGAPIPADGGSYYDRLSHDAVLLYLTSRHFPSRLPSIKAQAIEGLVKEIGDGRYTTLSSAYAIFALDAYTTAVGPVADENFTITQTLANGTKEAIPLSGGTFAKGDVTQGAKSLVFTSTATVPAFYQLLQSGFDRVIPTQALAEGIEVFREYTDKSGKPVTQFTVGDELQVHLRFRALGTAPIASVAIMDLLPGGFEVVEDRTPAEVERAPDAYADEGGGEGDGEGYEGGEEGGDAEGGWVSDFGDCIGGWSLDYSEIREDRVVLYATADRSAREFVYTVKVTAVGGFAAPPVYAEGMYDRKVRGWSVPSRIAVRAAR